MTEETLADSFTQLKNRSRRINYAENPAKFVEQVLDLGHKRFADFHSSPMALGALFDLAVTLSYLEKSATSAWYYCSSHDRNYLVYPFVNACPICTFEKNIQFLRARKPQSARIGAVTSSILATFLDLQAKRNLGPNAEVRTVHDNGPVDAYLKFEDHLVLFEIKSAPLIAFPAVALSDHLTTFDEEILDTKRKETHTSSDISPTHECFLAIDEHMRIPVGSAFKFPLQNQFDLAYDWLSLDDNLSLFIDSWTRTFRGYAQSDRRNSSYWLTSGCGVPSPRPANWPARKGSGFESISDGKSSVGMDRTDDLKKGIYQVLKISTHFKEFFPSNQLNIYSVLASNIHAVKHQSEYLEELKDIVWTIDDGLQSAITKTEEGHHLVKAGKLYNLFDAIVTFTSSHFRSDFIQKAFSR